MIELYLHMQIYLDYFQGRLKHAEFGKLTYLMFCVPVQRFVGVIG